MFLPLVCVRVRLVVFGVGFSGLIGDVSVRV